ncbi:MAG: hypothetical protein QG566_262 [Patescibacteria group bacterium]|nr:hypothetical protein [Patescibacteria group bacterium]
MEIPPIITPPPVPIPVSAVVKEFHKSKVILVIAYIQLVIYAFLFLLPIIFNRSSGSFAILLFIVPALVIIFTKSPSAYRIARIFFIVELVLTIVPMIILLFVFSNL